MSESQERTNFIWDAIDEDLKSGRCTKVHTRFPPEPNGHLHIGHCKALVTDFGTAEKYGGTAEISTQEKCFTLKVLLPVQQK